MTTKKARRDDSYARLHRRRTKHPFVLEARSKLGGDWYPFHRYKVEEALNVAFKHYTLSTRWGKEYEFRVKPD